MKISTHTRTKLLLVPLLAAAALAAWLALPGSGGAVQTRSQPNWPAARLSDMLMPVVTPGTQIHVHGDFFPAEGVDPADVQINGELRIVDAGGGVSSLKVIFDIITNPTAPETEPLPFTGALTVPTALGGNGSASLFSEPVVISSKGGNDRQLGDLSVSAWVDTNGDGKVDAADYVVWRKTDGT